MNESGPDRLFCAIQLFICRAIMAILNPLSGNPDERVVFQVIVHFSPLENIFRYCVREFCIMSKGYY